jgi:ribose 5-phosphate isomerase A
MTPAHPGGRDDEKRAAAERAVADVEDGMVLGLGSGSTAAFAIEALAARVAAGLRVLAVPTSEASAALARRLGVPLTSVAARRRIDVTIDGADEVERNSLDLIKGLGGALLREKIVASASDRMVVVVDETKLVDRLGHTVPLPVETASFGWQVTLARLAALDCEPRLRMAGGAPFTTDGGNYIVDCTFAGIPRPAELEARLRSIVGVVESGLFVGLASRIIVGRRGAVEVIDANRTSRRDQRG